MADIKTSILYVLQQEDVRMSGVITDVPGDSGGRTRWGIAETAHPELTVSGFYGGMNNTDSLVIAEALYESRYAFPLKLAAINDQRIANALLSYAINQGVEASVKPLQEVLATRPDGVLGTATLALVNEEDPVWLLTALGARQTQHYTAIIAAHPEDVRFRDGWLNRVQQNTTQAV